MKSAREPKPIDLSKLPEQFQHEQPDPQNFERFKQVMTALVAVPKGEAMGRNAFRKALKKSTAKTTKKSSEKK